MRCRQVSVLMVLFLTLTALGCGGSALNLAPSSGIGGAAVRYPWDDGAVKQSAGFTLNVWPDTMLDGARVEDYTLNIRETEAEVVVEVGVQAAIGLKAFYCDLSYDPERLTPLTAERGAAFGTSEDCLELAQLGERGRAFSGQVLVHWDRQAGFTGTAQMVSLRFARSPMPLSRAASLAPLGDMSAPELLYDAGTSTMSWYYFNNGDYNQDGLASINDLTPLGQHLYEQNGNPPAPWPVSDALSQIDGNSDGALTINDVTNIGRWLSSSTLGGWRLYSSSDQGDYPTANGEANGSGAVEVAVLGRSDALNPDNTATERLHFAHVLALPTPGDYYWVRATDAEGLPGTPSNMVQVPVYLGVELAQVDYTLDGASVTDSAHGSARLTFTGNTAVQYFNLVFNGTWVLQNVPVITYAGIGVDQTVTCAFDLGVEDGTDVTSALVGSSVDLLPLSAAPAGAVIAPVGTREVALGHGRPGALSPGAPANEIGAEVVDFAAHPSLLPNIECGLNECVPAAVSNSLTWLRQTTGIPTFSKPIDIGTIKTAVGWEAGGAPEGWGELKNTYMFENGYGISTDQHPDPDDIAHQATAAECQTALDAIKAGRDVELNGEGHCAALVAMAKLADGRFVLYVSHDTQQGHSGGQRVEKVIYDPAATNPLAEGGWGFNGLKLNGFVIEYPIPVEYTVAQVDYTLDDTSVADSKFGELAVYIEPNPGVRFINFVFDDVWVVRNVPVWVNLGDNGTYVHLAFPLGVDDGTDVSTATTGISLDDSARLAPPPAEDSTDVGTTEVDMGQGRERGISAGDAAAETGSSVLDSVPLRDGFTNQDCGHNECVPAAASNSLTWMRGQYGQPPASMDVGLTRMKMKLGYTYPGGTPAGWGGLKAKYLKENASGIRTVGYPLADDQDHVATSGECESAFQALKNGADVELNGEGHCAAIVGAHKLAGGRYVFYVAHDTNQARTQLPDNEPLANGGTKIEKVIYDPAAASPVAEGGWGFNGLKLNGFVAEFPPETIPNTTVVAVAQDDLTLQGVLSADSNQGDLVVSYDAQPADPLYLNYMHNGTWVVQNLPLPIAGTSAHPQQVNVPFALGVTPGTPLTNNYFSYSVTTDPVTEAPPDVELGGIENGAYIMNAGEQNFTITYGNGPSSSAWVQIAPVTDWAFLDPAVVVNQDCGLAECAPTAVSNSLKMLDNKNPGQITGPTGIEDMKPATDWSGGVVPGAPAIPIGGNFDTPTAWWNKKKQWMLDRPDYPILTEKITDAANLGDITDAIRAGKDVELRVPGHVVMVVGAVELANGDMILWVAHDTEQGTAGGTVLEPVRYDAAQGIFLGADWADGVQFGNGRALAVVENIGEPPPGPSFEYDWGYFMPGTGYITDPYVIFGNAAHPFTVTDPILGDVTNSGDVIVSADPPFGGVWVNGTYLISAGFEGTVKLTAMYKGQPTQPNSIYLDVLVSMPSDSVFTWPSQLTATDGEVVTTTVFCLWSDGLFFKLGGCRITMENANSYVLETANAGLPGGAADDVDGLWEQLSPTGLQMLSSDTPVDLGGGRQGFDFNVDLATATPLELATGPLFNIGIVVHSDVNLGLERQDGGGIDRTFYLGPLLNLIYWADDDNSGVPSITLVP